MSVLLSILLRVLCYFRSILYGHYIHTFLTLPKIWLDRVY